MDAQPLEINRNQIDPLEVDKSSFVRVFVKGLGELELSETHLTDIPDPQGNQTSSIR
jgi:hypothetical protein